MDKKLELVPYDPENDIFSKSNTLISSKYKASILEQKLLNIVLARLQQKKYIDKGDDIGLVCEIKAKELRVLLGLKGGSFYSQLKLAAANMTGRTIGFVNDEVEAFRYVSIISYSDYHNGTLTVKFNPEMKQYLNPKTQFTVLDLPIMLKYKNIYALRLHEILLSRCYKKKRSGVSKYSGKETDGNYFKIDIGLSELKFAIGAANAETSSVRKILNDSSAPNYDLALEKASEKSFDDWYEFRRKVIDIAVKEINKMDDNGMTVSYEPILKGHGGKTCGITFYVELGKKKKNEEKEATKDDNKNKRKLSENEQFEILFQAKSLLVDENVDLSDLKPICEAADYDIEKIKKAYDVAKNASNISNFVGFMIKAIKDDYSPAPIKKTTKKKKNSFNNFEQRQYNFDDLELGLLEHSASGVKK